MRYLIDGDPLEAPVTGGSRREPLAMDWWRPLVRGYQTFNYDWADARTNALPLVARPLGMVALVLGYLCFANRWGPALMARRRPLALRGPLVAYNALQVALNAWILAESAKIWFGKYNWRCQPIDWSHSPEAIWITRLVYAFFLLKLFDLLDTVFIVLRKKDRQISFLHKTHHFGMAIVGWCGVKYFPGGHGTFLGLINTAIHALMYSYYLLTALSPRTIWWKKYLTQLQMVQHALIGLHFGQLLVSNPCGYPLFPAVAITPLAAWVFWMFLTFYVNTYVHEHRK